MNENGFRNDATEDTLKIWKWTEIWIACNQSPSRIVTLTDSIYRPFLNLTFS